jgi:hypothetical protein
VLRCLKLGFVRVRIAFKGNGRSGWLTGSKPGTLDHQEGLLTEGESSKISKKISIFNQKIETEKVTSAIAYAIGDRGQGVYGKPKAYEKGADGV